MRAFTQGDRTAGVFATGDFSPNVFTGLLGAVMILVAYVADFLVTPAAFMISTSRRSASAQSIPEATPA